MDSKEKVLKNASEASQRLWGNRDPAENYALAVEALESAKSQLDIVMPEDLPLDPVTSLRSGIDQIATMSTLPPEAPVQQRASRVLEGIVTTAPNGPNQTLRSMEGSLAVGMVSSLGTLGAAIESRQEFLRNNPSGLLRNGEAADAVFDTVQKAKKVLDMMLPGMTTSEQISTLQDEVYKQITGDNLTPPPKSAPGKLDKAKKIADTVLGPDLRGKNSRITW